MKKFILLLSVIFLSSCRSGGDICCFNYSTSFDIIVKNSEGEDLLNPDTPNSLNTDKIKLFYLKNGVKEEVYYPNLDAPRHYSINLYEDNWYKIHILPNGLQSELLPVTYIEWNENDTDTIMCKIEHLDNAVLLKKLWYNNELKIDFSNPQYSDWVFEIIK